MSENTPPYGSDPTPQPHPNAYTGVEPKMDKKNGDKGPGDHQIKQDDPVDRQIDPGIQIDLANRFTSHAPKNGQQLKYAIVRGEALALAKTIVILTPNSREQSLALTKLEEVMFWSNAAIARNE
jgi:hypothetical protein